MGYNEDMKHELPDLPYAYNALEPHIDAQTMQLHHGKHHAAYVNKLNEALEKHPEVAEKPLEELLGDLAAVPEDIRTAVRNHGGGHLNHSMFWKMLCPSKESGQPEGKLAEAISASFGDLDGFKKQFGEAAGKIFGSGWAWLVLEGDKLAITVTPLQDNPIMQGKKPVLGLDVWEHAYYLKYQSKRPDYIEAWWNVVNWKEVAARLEA